MKFMTTNFVQCAVRECAKTSNAFPLQYTDLTLVRQEADFDPEFILNILPRLDWPALVQVAEEVSCMIVSYEDGLLTKLVAWKLGSTTSQA